MAAGTSESEQPRDIRRPRRRRRWALAALIVAWLAYIGVAAWRIRDLGDLPDIGVPFDMAAVGGPIRIADEDNAFVAYAEAASRLSQDPAHESTRTRMFVSVVEGNPSPPAWSSAPDELRRYVEANREALAIWRAGSGRRDGLYHQPGDLTFDSTMSLIPDAVVMSALAALEGSRLEEAGEREAAWDWYRAILRCSRLVGRHGNLLQRDHGARIHAFASNRIVRWAADESLGAVPLRKALRDVQEADALTPRVSEAVKIDALASEHSLASTKSFESILRSFGRSPPLLGGRKDGAIDRLVPWGGPRLAAQRVRREAGRELERSRRVFRLLCANWLAQADRPPSRQAPLATRAPIWIHADDPTAPPSARAISPRALADAIDGLDLSFLLASANRPAEPLWAAGGALGKERRRRSALIIRLAAEVYLREQGTAPTDAGALLGKVLETLPEGIAPADPIPTALD
ncbi:hypothetical protein [Singulisphaera sp. PoT]|uniref:hypothetical protein n=1 Tax=Singulisphaera sp. PoT TaxID=3411797 RepID=UPI003BF55FCD